MTYYVLWCHSLSYSQSSMSDLGLHTELRIKTGYSIFFSFSSFFSFFHSRSGQGSNTQNNFHKSAAVNRFCYVSICMSLCLSSLPFIQGIRHNLKISFKDTRKLETHKTATESTHIYRKVAIRDGGAPPPQVTKWVDILNYIWKIGD